MTNELTDVRCSCGDEYPADSYDAGFIAGSGMCQNCDAALPPKDICTCPSGDGSLRHPCPAHIGPFDKLVGSPVHNESEPDLPPLDEHLAQVFETGMALSESVEQAGGDERAAFFKHLIGRHPAHETEIVRVVEHNYAAWKAWQARAALAQPSPVPEEEKPGEILAAKLIETWVTKHGKPAPWSTAIEITAVATNMPNDERDRLLALDDDVDAQAQHSVPEGWMLVPVEQLLNMMSDKDHDTRIMAERQLLAVLAAAPSKEGL